VSNRGEAPLPQVKSGATSTLKYGAVFVGAPPRGDYGNCHGDDRRLAIGDVGARTPLPTIGTQIFFSWRNVARTWRGKIQRATNLDLTPILPRRWASWRFTIIAIMSRHFRFARMKPIRVRHFPHALLDTSTDVDWPAIRVGGKSAAPSADQPPHRRHSPCATLEN